MAARQEIEKACDESQAFLLARATGIEPATTGSTVRYSNQLSYAPKYFMYNDLRHQRRPRMGKPTTTAGPTLQPSTPLNKPLYGISLPKSHRLTSRPSLILLGLSCPIPTSTDRSAKQRRLPPFCPSAKIPFIRNRPYIAHGLALRTENKVAAWVGPLAMLNAASARAGA